MSCLATRSHPPRPRPVRSALAVGRPTARALIRPLTGGAKQPYLDSPRTLAAGWPIAAGVIEGACRHLVAERISITEPAGAARRRSHPAAARHPRQRRPGRPLDQPHPARTPAQPLKPLPQRPRTSRMTLTSKSHTHGRTSADSPELATRHVVRSGPLEGDAVAIGS